MPWLILDSAIATVVVGTTIIVGRIRAAMGRDRRGPPDQGAAP